MEQQIKISFRQIQFNYQQKKILGAGRFGKVYLYKKKKEDLYYALKIISTDKMQERREALQQIQILRMLKHKQIITIFKYYDQTRNLEAPPRVRYEIGLLLQLGKYSLQQCLKDKSFQITFCDLKKFIVQFIQLGAYLEEKSIIHRDIKPGNIIIFGDRLQFKLADFGLSCKADQRPNGFAGTLNYCSPYLKNFYLHGDKSKIPLSNPFKDDVYSFGVTSQEIMKRFNPAACPSEITNLLDLLGQCLNQNDKQRPKFKDLLDHKMVQSYLTGNSFKHKEQQAYQGSTLSIAMNIDYDYPCITEKWKIQEKKQLLKCTEKQNISLKTKVKIISGSNFPIRTICKIHPNYILCGGDTGELMVINIEKEEFYLVNLKHKNYVAKVCLDQNTDIWTAGGDGTLFFIKRQIFLMYVEQRVEVEIPSKTLITSKSTIQKRVIIPESDVERIALITKSKSIYISDIRCLNREKFVVGFCNGYIYVRWQNDSKQYQSHVLPITSIRIINEKIYSSDFGGFIKIYSLVTKLIQNKCYKTQGQLIDFLIKIEKRQVTIDTINCRGSLQTVNRNKSIQTTFHVQHIAKNIIGAVFNEDRTYFCLTTNGIVFYKNTAIFIAEAKDSQSWNCIVPSSNNELIIGNIDGTIGIIAFQQ